MTEQKAFRVETLIHAPLETVWQALTEPDRIREWFGWDYDGIEAEIRYIFVDHAQQLPDEHRIVLEEDQEIQLSADGPERTVVRVVCGGAAADGRYDGVEEGWRTFLEQLRFWLEREGVRSRRTVYMTGSANAAMVRDSLQTTGTQIWHTSRFQHILVDTDGHLVAISAEQPLDTAEPVGTGPVAVTVSAYGVDDAAFAGLSKEWAVLWGVLARDVEVVTTCGDAEG
ncbi:SRPBCC family protein [Streptomyces spiramyceticus]|uniref:SRPBCC family protein n=1 Tax=Streptomyces spiramyceticus TaxID=299717 RepID=UPI00237B48BF|nr:SRPBCC domain-containing protein [Streptomyces spiramyceticus]